MLKSYFLTSTKTGTVLLFPLASLMWVERALPSTQMDYGILPL